MDQSAKFWDRIAERYSKQPVADEAAYQKELQITREYLQPDMEVLELGCGTGSTAIKHASYVKHIHAIDISSKMIGIAERKAADDGINNITFETSPIEDINVPDQSLDAVLALNVLHLLENKEEVAMKVHNMLKPGGIFVSSTACLADMMWVFKFIAPIGKFFGLLPSVKAFTAKELKDCLIDTGFEIDHQWQPSKNKAAFIVAIKPK